MRMIRKVCRSPLLTTRAFVRKQTYPRDENGYSIAASDEILLGRHREAIPDSQRTMGLLPGESVNTASLCQAYLALNRIDEAKAVLDRGIAAGIDPSALAYSYYTVAFLRNDQEVMNKQVALALGRSEAEDLLASTQSDSEAYHGRLKLARDDSHRAADGRYVPAQTALVLARAGDSLQAQSIVDQLAKDFPQDTLVNSYWLPMARAAIALNRHNSAEAVEALRVARSYELGAPLPNPAPLGPIFFRGQAYLAGGQNKEAAAEFQRILDNRGITLNSPIGSLAHLCLGRALAAAGETDKARTAYQDFFALWKDADPDIPILVQAKSEYAKLR
jgi:predicted Zn-dependent protease